MGVPAEKELPSGSDAAEGRAGAASLCRRGTWATSVGSPTKGCRGCSNSAESEVTRHQEDSDSAESAVLGKSPRAWCKHSCRGEDGGWLCHGAAATTPSLAESAEEGTKVDRLPPPGWMGVPAEKELPPGSDAAEGRAGAASLCRRGTWATSVGSHRALVRKPSKWSPRRPRPKQRVPSPRGRYQTAVGGGRDGTRAAMTRNGLEWPFTRPTFLTGHPRPRTPPGGGTSRPQRR